jgi:hypothetical protein
MERETVKWLYTCTKDNFGWLAGVVNEWMAVLITNGAFGCGLHFARLPGICNSRYIEKLELKKRSTAVGWVGGVVAGFIVWTREMTSVLHSFIFWLAISRKNEIASFLKFLPSFREREEKSRECLDSIYQSQLERIALFMSCESANAADWKCIVETTD